MVTVGKIGQVKHVHINICLSLHGDCRDTGIIIVSYFLSKGHLTCCDLGSSRMKVCVK